MFRWRETHRRLGEQVPTVAIVTEVGDNARQAALERGGWKSYVPPMRAGEVGVAWDAAVHRCRPNHRWGRVVTDLPFNNRPGVVATAAFLTDQDVRFGR